MHTPEEVGESRGYVRWTPEDLGPLEDEFEGLTKRQLADVRRKGQRTARLDYAAVYAPGNDPTPNLSRVSP